MASAYSILDILYVLYDRVLDCGMIKKNSETRDRFILSKGHAAIGYYAVLKKFGFIEDGGYETSLNIGISNVLNQLTLY